MGTSCNLCMQASSPGLAEHEIESIERKNSNRDILKYIILIQSFWRGYIARKKCKCNSKESHCTN